ncbi:diacylglyceryl transferase [Pikeienuella piscinae]|uniref:Diacylglyceryl transferase n=1 Tax=Pikeienuella piscinae TaxID=2748098 RepID=A0A7L5C0R9_9RHOB|nr:YbjN domain-containing protein [Pikeienuella piscinae]QIE55439.1 diacylglyceryl transferase [Pikeienuella piscinae]
MEAVEHDFNTDDLNPIDIVETLAERRDWEFDRVGEDQIAMAVEGVWRTYSLTLAWCGRDETLRLISTFEMDPPAERRAELALLLDRANDLIWSGCFNLWDEQKLMVFRYGLTLAGGAVATASQIDAMLRGAVSAAERFYPAFQLVAWGEESAEAALAIAMSDAVGRA